jgi:hypothetical protein
MGNIIANIKLLIIIRNMREKDPTLPPHQPPLPHCQQF